MGFDWKKALGAVAPAITKAIGLGGGPAGAAVAVLSRALLGHEKGSADDVAEVLAAGATPEQLERIQAAEREFSLKLLDTAAQLERIEAEDRVNARARETAVRDRMPAVLAITLTVGMFGTIALLSTVKVPPENKENLMLLVGSLATAWAGAMVYYHGSSSGSKSKDAVNAALLHRLGGR